MSRTRSETSGERFRLGPGLIMAASGIGASDIIAATVGGAMFGRALIWALLIGALFKFILSEGIARWQLATGSTALEGWAHHFPRWVLGGFTLYLLLWSIAVSGALISGCGLAIENVSGGSIPRSWGASAHVVLAVVVIFTVGTRGFTRLMKPLIAIMFVSIVACSAVTLSDPLATLRSLLSPELPPAAGRYVFSLIGGVGGTVTLLSYNYLLRDEGQVDPHNLRAVRLDLGLAYLFTAVFGLSVMLIAERVFHSVGIVITDRDAVSRMASDLGVLLGPAGFCIYSIGFWAAVIASLLGVWETIPSVFADCYSLLRRLPERERAAAMCPSSLPYRSALIFMAVAAMPFAFLARPLLVIITFTVLGSLFIPFLAGTLLYLNNAIVGAASIHRNRITTNCALIVILLIFIVVGVLEIWEQLR